MDTQQRSASGSAPAVDWELGPGPIASIWFAIGTSIDEATAVGMVTAPEIVTNLDEDGVDELLALFMSVAEDQPYRAAIGARLLRAVAEALQAAQDELRWRALIGCTEIHLRALQVVADPDVLREGVELATSLAESAAGTAREPVALNQLGLMYIGPITSRVDQSNFWLVMRRRMERATEDAMLRPRSITPLTEQQVDPKAALEAGMEVLQRSMQLATGRVFAVAARATMSALRWLTFLGSPERSAEIVSLGTAALQALGTDDPCERAALVAELCTVGEAPVEAIEGLLALRIEDLIATYGPAYTGDVALSVLDIVAARPDLDGIGFARTVVPLLTSVSEESAAALMRIMFRVLTVPVLIRLHQQEGFELTPAWVRSFVEREAWSGDDRARALMLLATDVELPFTERMEHWQAALDASPELAGAFEPVLGYGLAGIVVDTASASLAGDDRAACVYYNALALPLYLRIGLPDGARECLTLVAIVLDQTDEDLVAVTVDSLSSMAAEIESLADGPHAELLHLIWRRTLALAVQHQHGLESFVVLFQLAKSARFAAVLRGGGPPPGVTDDPRLRELLHEANRLRGDRPSSAAVRSPLLAELLLVMPYSDRLDTLQSRSAVERAENLERMFDAVLQRTLLQVAGPFVPRTPDEVLAVLPAGTVLWSIYLGHDIERRPCLYSMLLAPGEPPVVAPRTFPDLDVALAVTDGRRNYVANGLESKVAEVRLAVQEPAPRGAVATPDACDLLAWLATELFPEVMEQLVGFAEHGGRHLVIDPCGPLHFLPFHLIGPAGAPLGQAWTVTLVPSIEALFPHGPVAAAPRAVPLEVFGMTFRDGGGHGLEPLWGVQGEVADIEATTGVHAHLDAAVDEGSLVDGLERARWVHVASHGRHDVVAPSLQTIYVTPTAHDDGMLRAFELLGLDLAGLDLVTLSACETALGRLDEGGNLRGIPAALLLGGARAVVATLWPVADAAARTFFAELYRRLATDETPLAAFAAARSFTRERHPRYAHWGAFTFLGAIG